MAVLAGTACSSSKGSTPPTSTTATAVTTTTVAKPHRPSRATRGYPSSDDAVNAFMDDWEHDRKAHLYLIADEAAVIGVYKAPAGPPSQNRGCAEPNPPALPMGGCAFLMAGEAGLLQVQTEQRPVGWVVTQAIYEPLASDSH